MVFPGSLSVSGKRKRDAGGAAGNDEELALAVQKLSAVVA